MNNSSTNFMPQTFTNSTPHSITSKEGLNIFLYSISFLFGLPAHSYIIWLIVTGSGVASEFFNLNLSVCEIFISLYSLINVLSARFTSVILFSNFMQGLGITGRPLFQCLICVERYLAVVHPVTFLKSKPLRYRLICCSVVWIITLASCFSFMIFLFFINFYTYACMTSVNFLLFLLIKLYCLVAVLRALKQSRPGDRRRNEEIKRRAFDLILITTVNMVIMYVPLTLSGFIMMQQNALSFWVTGVVCYILAGFVQPVLYLHRAGKLSYCTSVAHRICNYYI